MLLNCWQDGTRARADIGSGADESLVFMLGDGVERYFNPNSKLAPLKVGSRFSLPGTCTCHAILFCPRVATAESIAQAVFSSRW